MLLAKIKKILTKDWVIGLGLLLVFLITNGYTYAWDDQHLEIPLLKSLIDPELYPNDYYVDALKINFTSFLFPLLAKIITIEQIPIAYFILYLISRFFLFFYAYKLWEIVAKNKLNAILCVLSFILVFRVEEFLYRTFSHQEFALGIIMAGMYYFYKDHFGRAAILFGVAANFHALYSLFPFCFMMLCLSWKTREARGKNIMKPIGLFILCSLPLVVWTLKRLFLHTQNVLPSTMDWIELYLIACPATFLFDNIAPVEMLKNFSVFLKGTHQFWPVIALYLLNHIHNPEFRKDPKAIAIMTGATVFILISFIFSYLLPTKFILDLNLVRNLQFMQFILIGYTTLLLIERTHRGLWEKAGILIILFSLLRFGNTVAALACLAMVLLLNEKQGLAKGVAWGLFTLTLAIIGYQFKSHHFSFMALNILYVTVGATIVLYATYCFNKNNFIKTALILLPFLTLTVNSAYYHKVRVDVENKAGGFWQLQRNWIDMQNFVRKNTPKNALIMTPNDMEMGGFRIFSERRVVVCYRDCGIIGFDYAAANEWQKRLKDVEHFKVMIDGDISPAIYNAITKYKANYIVFMRYLNTGNTDLLQPVYENETFSLYRVAVNPL